jgi:hypothetical protein
LTDEFVLLPIVNQNNIKLENKLPLDSCVYCVCTHFLLSLEYDVALPKSFEVESLSTCHQSALESVKLNGSSNAMCVLQKQVESVSVDHIDFLPEVESLGSVTFPEIPVVQTVFTHEVESLGTANLPEIDYTVVQVDFPLEVESLSTANLSVSDFTVVQTVFTHELDG